MDPSSTGDCLEGLLARATAALEAGDPDAAAEAVAGALAHLAAGPPPDPLRFLAAHARLSELASRESARLSLEISRLGSSRRARGAYRSG